MDEEYKPIITDEERATRRAQRAEARRKKQREKRRRLLRRLVPCGLLAVLCVGLVTVGAQLIEKPAPEMVKAERPFQVTSVASAPAPEPYARAVSGPDTIQLGEDFPSRCAVLVDLDTRTVLAEKNADTVISPASMTKVLTVLVAAEHITEAELDDTFTMTIDITDYCYVNGCSVVGLMVDETVPVRELFYGTILSSGADAALGLMVDETVPVRELFYGTILSSGADAALGLATYVAGSQEAFVALMNEKLEELGIADTAHFTNCVGLYDETHKCTVRDMAVILEAAMDNNLCREVLGARTYETLPTADHPEGQILSNWFLRRIEDKDTGSVTVTGAKTGYVAESGNCAVSCGETADGRRYICVTADAYSAWRAIYDHTDLYRIYCSGETPEETEAEPPVLSDGDAVPA